MPRITSFFSEVRLFVNENNGVMCFNYDGENWEVTVNWEDGKAYAQHKNFNHACAIALGKLPTTKFDIV